MADKGVISVAIEDEVKESYLNYAMSVIVSRALPDVRDGLKPVQRRILHAMGEMGLRHDRANKKCGRIVGDVLGKFHPHADQSIYEALVRLAQEFSLRIPVVDGQGNFGSVDGDPPAAMRYTEAKLAKISDEILRDIKKDTVNFVANYDGSMEEPEVLPTAFPYLLVNGGSGIAVGMATNLPPHNLGEICEALCAVIDNPEIETKELLSIVKGPDFPTAGILRGSAGFHAAATTGRGRVTVQARCDIEELPGGREGLVVTELPYMVNKATLIMRIADLVREKKIEGIGDLNDESDREGMRIVIKLKKGFSPQVVLNQLFQHTALQSNFNVNNLVLVNGGPKLCTLKNLLSLFVDHRREIITRRTRFELNKAKERGHLLEGLKIALENIDEVVEIIKKSRDSAAAQETLMQRFALSAKQTKGILEMKLQRITSLETQKILEELAEIVRVIAALEDLLAHEEKILTLIKEESREIARRYGDERRTQIVWDEAEILDLEDMIEKEDVVVLISNKGYINRVPVSAYKEQARGGKGSNTARLKEGDFVERVFIASTHSYIVCVSSQGKAYWLKVFEIPEGSRGSRGRHIRTLLHVGEEETITTTTALEAFDKETSLFMATRRGIVKRVLTHDFRNARKKGIAALTLDQGDQLVEAKLTGGDSHVVLVTRRGKGLKWHETSVRIMGRNARGVRGIRLEKGDELVGACLEEEKEALILLSRKGFGKRMNYSELMPHGRGTGGQRVYKRVSKTGDLVGALSVKETDNLVCITTQGKAIRMGVQRVSLQGRNTSGVMVVNTGKDTLVGVARIQHGEDEADFLQDE